jgi:hypothetical protein
VTRSPSWSAALKASYRVHLKSQPNTPMTPQQLCRSAVSLFWAALSRAHESRRNDAEKRIVALGQDALAGDTELVAVCLRWLRQANSQAAAIREQEEAGKRKLAGGSTTESGKRTCSSAPFASPIADSSSSSSSSSTSAGTEGTGGGGSPAAARATPWATL